MDENFHGGELILSDLQSGGVGIVKTQLTAEVTEAVERAEQAIITGEIKVPETVESN